MRGSAQTPVSAHGRVWLVASWPRTCQTGARGMLKGGRLLRAGEGAAQKGLEPGRGRASTEGTLIARTFGLPGEPPPVKLWGSQPAPGRAPPGFPPTPGDTLGAGGRGQPGAGTHHDAAAARPASPRAAAAPHGRDGRAAAALYRGRHRRSGAGRPARDDSVRFRAFA